ncbi:hypothetical protein M426DRAFT_258518 [Hypoxylon sp. CI-4A]|nr:hypothetical protein M426DRAFT_258518 [Hypoxylon sp. CI-4A]
MSDLDHGFPDLQPAIISKIHIGEIQILGSLHDSSRTIHFGMPTGTIETVPGFEPAFKAEVNFGADWMSFDAEDKFSRVNLRGVAKTDKGHSIDYHYTAVAKLEPSLRKLLTGAPDAETIPFGLATGHYKYRVGDPGLKELENNVFVGNARIIKNDSGVMTVETRQSLVISSTVMD